MKYHEKIKIAGYVRMGLIAVQFIMVLAIVGENPAAFAAIESVLLRPLAALAIVTIGINITIKTWRKYAKSER